MTSSRQALPRLGRAVAVAVAAEAALVHLGRTYGSTREERSRRLPGDEVVADPVVQTDHAITIDAPPSAVWPWLVQMGWGRGGWYTARWVDRVLFPANGPSADRVVPERALVLRSTSHLPPSWRDRATLDWTWAFVLTPVDDGRGTRYHFRSRWVTQPWWLTLGGRFGLVPADFLMSRDALRGVKQRAERLAAVP